VLEQGYSLAWAAEAAGVSERTAAKWLGRYRAEGEAGLADRSSAPGEGANRTPEEPIELLAALRRLRMTAAEIAETRASDARKQWTRSPLWTLMD
jgi:transposase